MEQESSPEPQVISRSFSLKPFCDMRLLISPICKIITIIDPSERFWWNLSPLWKPAKHSCCCPQMRIHMGAEARRNCGMGSAPTTSQPCWIKSKERLSDAHPALGGHVTQCYFWDSLNSMWKSSGCQDRPPLFFILSSVKYDCFTVCVGFCCPNKANQPYTHHPPLPFSGLYRALSLSYCASQQVPASYLFHTCSVHVVSCFSHAQLTATQWTIACQSLLRQEYWVDCRLALFRYTWRHMYVSLISNLPLSPCAHRAFSASISSPCPGNKLISPIFLDFAMC